MSELRRATIADINVLEKLIEESVRTLQRDAYTQRQIDLALIHVYGVDALLIDDATYFVLEDAGAIVACGGWSKRATLHGGDAFADRTDGPLDVTTDAAKIRAFYVRPAYARRGCASLLLRTCEREALRAGFGRAELSATVTGVPFYAARGYVERCSSDVALPYGELLRVVRMERSLVDV